MFNKKLIFALIILIMAISSVSASDFNSTDDAYANGDGDLEQLRKYFWQSGQQFRWRNTTC